MLLLLLLLFKSLRLRSTEALRPRVCACTTDHPVQSFKPELRFKPNIEFRIRRKYRPSGFCRVDSAPAEESSMLSLSLSLSSGEAVEGMGGWSCCGQIVIRLIITMLVVMIIIIIIMVLLRVGVGGRG